MNKKFLIFFGIILLTVLIAWQSLVLVPTRDRKIPSYVLTRSQRDQIRQETKGMTPDQIIDYSLSMTARDLTFTRKVNCVTYANYSSAICNCAFSANFIKGKAKPKVGTVKLWGLDLCEILYSITQNTFVINHDFTEISLPERTVYVDASFYDLIKTDCRKVVRN